MKRYGVILATLLLSSIASTARAQDTPVQALRDVLALGAFYQDTADAIIGLFQAQTTTFPISSSSGGFTWTFDPQLGVATRRSNSFGPMFAERPLTTGRGKLNLTVAYQATQWKSIADENLEDGIPFTFTFNALNERDEFTSTVDLRTTRTTVGVSYGVHDKIDVGVAVPIATTSVSGVSAFEARRISNGQLIRSFEEGSDSDASGIGDIVLRGKYAFYASDMMDLAAGVDLRLPTGDEEKLLGAGKASTKFMVIGSTTRGNIAPHFNVGYTFAGEGVIAEDLGGGVFFAEEVNPSDEFDYTFGADVAATEMVTIAGDIVGRALRNSIKLTRRTDSFSSYIDFEPATVNLLLGSIGAKVKLGNMWLITGAIAFPLSSNGIKPGITPVIGFERAF